MLVSNTMRFGSDEFAFAKQSLLVSKIALDAAGQTSVDGFNIEGIQPTGTNRRLLFNVDNKIWKFNGQTPVEYTGTLDIESVLAKGNTVDEVNAVTSIPDWVNKKIYPIIAMDAPIDATVLPTMKVTLKVKSNTEIFERTIDTAEIEIGNEGATPQLVELKADTSTTGNGHVEVSVRIKTGDTWSSYMSLPNAEGKDANAVQFRAQYRVNRTDGTDTAKVNWIKFRYTTGVTAVSGEVAELYSVVQDFGDDLSTAILSIRHKKLSDSIIRAYVNFLPPTKRRVLIPIGVASGSSEQMILGVDGVRDTGIDQKTIQLYSNGTPLMSFSYNTEVSEVTLTAPTNAAITASYEYNHAPEVWREMTKDIDQQPFDDGTVQTRFSYSLNDEEEQGLTVANIRMQLFRTSGHTDGEVLGVGTGGVQMFVLSHAAKEETIDCNADWSYNADSQILTAVAPRGEQIVANYDWLGEQQVLYSWTAGYSVQL